MTQVVATLRECWQKNWPEVHAAITGGLPEFIFARHPRELGSTVPVFCYHTADAQRFERDLDFLSRNGYVTIDADTLLDHLEERHHAPERAVVLTVDDGARNLYEVMFPLLKHHGMGAVAFVSPRFHLEVAADLSHYKMNGLSRPLDWSQIMEMHESGVIDFQSHTYEHRFVPRWPEAAPLVGSDPELVSSLRGPVLTVEEDFQLARETLEQKLNKTVRHLAFTKYIGTKEAICIGRELGYRGFYWGTLPHNSYNRPGQSPGHIGRLDYLFVRRLPGEGREPLSEILPARFSGTAARLRRLLRRPGRGWTS